MHRHLVIASALGLALTAASAAGASQPPVLLATCGESRFELIAPAGEGNGEMRALLATPGNRWRFKATVSMARVGGRTRTVTVEDLKNEEGRPVKGGKDVAPSQLFIDLFLDDKKIVLRHGSEGGDDPEYAADLTGCTFAPDGDVTLAAFAPRAPDPAGCAPDTLRGHYLPQIQKAAKLAAADADREAAALCEDHQKTIAARNRLEQTISDRAARERTRTRGLALIRTEETRKKGWSLVDGCLSRGGPPRGRGVAGLHDSEAKTRACYERIAGKL